MSTVKADVTTPVRLLADELADAQGSCKRGILILLPHGQGKIVISFPVSPS